MKPKEDYVFIAEVSKQVSRSNDVVGKPEHSADLYKSKDYPEDNQSNLTLKEASRPRAHIKGNNTTNVGNIHNILFPQKDRFGSKYL